MQGQEIVIGCLRVRIGVERMEGWCRMRLIRGMCGFLKWGFSVLGGWGFLEGGLVGRLRVWDVGGLSKWPEG